MTPFEKLKENLAKLECQVLPEVQKFVNDYEKMAQASEEALLQRQANERKAQNSK